MTRLIKNIVRGMGTILTICLGRNALRSARIFWIATNPSYFIEIGSASARILRTRRTDSLSKNLSRKNKNNPERRHALERPPSLGGNLPSILPDTTESVQSITTTRSTSFKGPLPPPEILVGYNDATPDGAARIIAMADRSEQRHKLEMKAIEAQIKDQAEQRLERRRGQYLGFGIGVVTVICGTIAIAFGSPLAGGFLGTGGVVALVGAFLFEQRSSRENHSTSKGDKEKPKLPGTEAETHKQTN